MSESDCIEKFLEKFKSIQDAFLDFLDDEDNLEINFYNLCKLFEDSKIKNCQHDVRLFLRLLLKVANNHHRCPNFFSKIDRILKYFSDDIKKYKKDEIFRLFQSNKRLLLFLIEEKILPVDEYFGKQICSNKYLSKEYIRYFAPEIKQFTKEKWFPKNVLLVREIEEKMPDNFDEMRKNGENCSYLSKLIREDLVKDFIVHVNKLGITPDAMIKPSIYETNSFLIKKKERNHDD